MFAAALRSVRGAAVWRGSGALKEGRTGGAFLSMRGAVVVLWTETGAYGRFLSTGFALRGLWTEMHRLAVMSAHGGRARDLMCARGPWRFIRAHGARAPVTRPAKRAALGSDQPVHQHVQHPRRLLARRLLVLRPRHVQRRLVQRPHDHVR